jgi:hypothetical protein
MFIKTSIACAALAAAFSLGYMVRGSVPGEPVAFAQGNRVFELRTYTAGEGKLELLHARFRNHTLKFFQQHGMTNVLYGKPLDPPLSQNTMLYLLAYPSREAAKKSWDAFRADPGWVKARDESGVGQVKVDSVYFEPTDYSPMK